MRPLAFIKSIVTGLWATRYRQLCRVADSGTRGEPAAPASAAPFDTAPVTRSIL